MMVENPREMVEEVPEEVRPKMEELMRAFGQKEARVMSPGEVMAKAEEWTKMGGVKEEEGMDNEKEKENN